MKKNNKKKIIQLKEFNKLDSIAQYEIVEKKLSIMYDNTNISESLIKKVLKICFNKEKQNTMLPEKLLVVKNNDTVAFEFQNSDNLVLFLLFLLGFFIAGIILFYFMNKINKNNLNDNGININIDLDDDDKCDINCDVDNDGIPDYNIDYK